MFGKQFQCLDGCEIIRHVEKIDNRGFFKYLYQQSDLISASKSQNFVPLQVNHSWSQKGVLRGIHREPWSKLVYVPSGRALLCVVNLVPESSQYGGHMMLTIGDFEGGRVGVFIPEGFGNGFYCIQDSHYFNLVSREFVDIDRSGYRWNDPSLGIKWDIDDEPVLSEQDKSWPLLQMGDLKTVKNSSRNM